ncbi:Cof-type HAD-IIB family hydrolase [Mesoplasma syrphidae]|uniref:Cof-type HAD-IIB family hydrolase n=1 Tax=Mesoplasma syrphidae TaxID=225999 RepID=A0A2K9BKL5_9MOLU|nr:Cof-type HAD-IIB family hydrolase [Mesoplasma syrphidae]AUF83776.1 Cof-type HAD-IIB family hydrolase [Mesoplasma syrphidae]
MNNIKLLVLDMDGTSYYKMGEIVPDNIEPIKKAQDQGVGVMFVTGRPVLAKQNNLEGHGLVRNHAIIAGCNGACIYDLQQQKVLASNPIDAKDAQYVFELAKQPEFAGTQIWGYVDDLKNVVVQYRNDKMYFGEAEFFDGKIQQYDEVSKNFDFKFFKLLALGAKPGFVQKLREQTNLEIASGDDVVAEINATGINKRFALDWFSEYLNIPIANMMAVGDGMNDYSMIKHAGIGVAMSNSVQNIKDIADLYIDIHGHDAAVKHLIEKYILK